MKFEHEIRHGDLKVYVTADKGTHHSTIASEVWKYIQALPQPEYVSSVTRTRQGKWCYPQYAGPFKLVGSSVIPDDSIRKTFNSWPVPN